MGPSMVLPGRAFQHDVVKMGGLPHVSVASHLHPHNNERSLRSLSHVRLSTGFSDWPTSVTVSSHDFIVIIYSFCSESAACNLLGSLK